jgi:hypothetical protein
MSASTTMTAKTSASAAAEVIDVGLLSNSALILA